MPTVIPRSLRRARAWNAALSLSPLVWVVLLHVGYFTRCALGLTSSTAVAPKNMYLTMPEQLMVLLIAPLALAYVVAPASLWAFCHTTINERVHMYAEWQPWAIRLWPLMLVWVLGGALMCLWCVADPWRAVSFYCD